MPKEKTVMIPLKQISNRFDVRTALDEDRVLQLVGCYEGGVELPPILVVPLDDENPPSYAYVDGRHRGAAAEFCNLTEISAVVVENPNDPAELFAQALEANYGGAKPPTRADIEHTVLRMLELGATQTSIRERLSFLPSGASKAYIAAARSLLMKRRIRGALDAIGDGATVAEAAKEHKIPLEALKDVVSGKKGKWGTGRTTEVEFGVAMKSYISKELRSANSGIYKKIEFLLDKVEEGEVSYKVAYEVIRAWGEYTRKTGIRISDWRARLNAISGNTDKASMPVGTEQGDTEQAQVV